MYVRSEGETELDWLEESISYLRYQMPSFLHCDFPARSLVSFVWSTETETNAKISTW